MDDRFRRSLKASTVGHIVFLFVIILVPLVMNWRIRKKDKEFIQFIDLTVAMPQVPDIKEVDEIKRPEAPKPPEPKPVSKDIPEPPKKKKKIEVSKKKIKRSEPAQPSLSKEEIKKLLAAGAKISDRTSVPAGNVAGAWYYALVRQAMYDAWNQPGSLSASAGLVTEVEIRVERNGTVTRRRMTRSSGNPLMDDSVMEAANSVTQLKPLPPEFGGKAKDIVIQFELTRGAL